MEIVFLERGAVGEDIGLSAFEKLGHITVYGGTLPEEVPERAKEADILVINRLRMDKTGLAGAKKLKLITVTATGTDMIDWDYVNERGIKVANVRGYSTDAVAQHTMAMALCLIQRLEYYKAYVRSGAYCEAGGLYEFDRSLFELRGKTWGILGLGAIGRRVAELASAFGCRIIYASASGKNTNQPYELVSMEELFRRSDILSVHAPLNEFTRGLMDRDAFRQMKKESIFLNLGRGSIVSEEALAEALEAGEIRAAGLDVLAKEPMAPDSPLLPLLDSEKLLITPHIAWTPLETRRRVMEQIYEEIKTFLQENFPQ